MPQIGSRSLARIILDAHSDNSIPADWRYVGGGSYRHVYLHEPTGVVYKVETGTFYGDGEYENDAEVKNAQRLYRKSAGDGIITGYLRIPRTSGYRFLDATVVAMEYVEGRYGNDADDQAKVDLFRIGRFADMHMYNFLVDADGYAVPVDMASPRRRASTLTPENYNRGELPDTRVLQGTATLAEFHTAMGW